MLESEVGLQLIQGVLKYLRDNNPLTTLDDDKEKLLTREEKEAFGLDKRKWKQKH